MKVSGILALVVMFLAIIGMIFYVLWRIDIIFGIPYSKCVLLVISFLFACLGFCTVWYGGENLFLMVLGTFSSWLVILFFLLLIFLGIEHVISIWYRINPWIIMGIFLVILLFGIFSSLHTKVINLDIESDKLDRDMKVLLVSDIHVDYIFYTYHIKTIGNLIRKEHPDLVLFAGDLLNRPHLGYVNAYRYFKDNNFDVPIYAIMGNHDVFGEKNIYSKISDVSSIKFLDNESVIVDGIQLVGVVDKSVWGLKDLSDNLEQANMLKSEDVFTIFLTHQPISLKKLGSYPIDLEVAGHTHHGQFFGFRELVGIVNDYGYGKFEENGKIAFVTQGIGTWGLPFRLGTQSEAVIINLKKK